MEMPQLRKLVMASLIECEAVYNTRRTAAQLMLLADIWADDLAEFVAGNGGRQAFMDAMRHWRQNMSCFPTPADIIPRLVARLPKYEEPEPSGETHPELAGIILKALRGDQAARQQMQSLRVKQ